MVNLARELAQSRQDLVKARQDLAKNQEKTKEIIRMENTKLKEQDEKLKVVIGHVTVSCC